MANDLLGKMTVLEKAVQMVMAMNPTTQNANDRAPGAVFFGGAQGPSSGNSPANWASFVDTYIAAGKESRLGIPFLYGIDAVHGHYKATATVIFPHNAGLGSTAVMCKSTKLPMRRLGVDPYLPAIRAGLGTVMVSDARWNGRNMTSHKQLITDILKGEDGFKGFVATDWDAAAQAGGVAATVNAGVDMLMQSTDWAKAADTIANSAGSEIPTERIDDAARRTLTVKCEAGLFDWKRDPELLKKVGSPEQRAVARRAVRESLVLLRHENSVLPAAGSKLESTHSASAPGSARSSARPWQRSGPASAIG